MRNVFRKNAVRPLVVFLVLTASLGSFAAYRHAHADTSATTCNGYSGYSYCTTFNLLWKWDSQSVDSSGFCCITVHYRLIGALGYNRVYTGIASDYKWSKQTLLNPVLSAYVFLRSCYNGVCALYSDTTDKLEMKQYWSGWACDFNPTFTLNAPWGVSFGGWINCGNRDLATYPPPQTDIVYGHNSNYQQANDGANAHIQDWVDAAPPCYGVQVSSWFMEGNNHSNGFGGGAKQVCLPWPPNPI